MSFWSKKRRPSRSKRVLTLTYYIEPRNLRMITIPMARLQAATGIVAVLAGWGLVSMILMSVDLIDAQKAASKVAALPQKQDVVGSSSIQVRQVAESKPSVVLPKEKKAGVSDKVDDKDAFDYDRVMAEQIKKIENEPEAQAIKENLNKLAALSQPALPNAARIDSKILAIEDLKHHRKRDEMKVRFALTHSGAGKIRGTVYGIADFQLPNGSVMQIRSHNDVNPKFLAANRNVGESYSARRLTHKRLKFKAPAGSKGKFKNIRVIVNEQKHSEPLIHSEQLP